MKKQGLNVTIGQLRRIADELEKELKETYKKCNAHYPIYAATHQQLHQINIINQEGLSDTWEIEEVGENQTGVDDSNTRADFEASASSEDSQLDRKKKQGRWGRGYARREKKKSGSLGFFWLLLIAIGGVLLVGIIFNIFNHHYTKKKQVWTESSTKPNGGKK